jgi:hypothetical protein
MTGYVELISRLNVILPISLKSKSEPASAGARRRAKILTLDEKARLRAARKRAFSIPRPWIPAGPDAA